MKIYTVYSPHDGGWYCEVYRTETGEQLHQTRVYRTKEKAQEAAKKWIGAKARAKYDH